MGWLVLHNRVNLMECAHSDASVPLKNALPLYINGASFVTFNNVSTSQSINHQHMDASLCLFFSRDLV